MAVALLSGCGHQPTAPGGTDAPVPVGLVILRLVPRFPCVPSDGKPAIFPEVRTRINLTHNGSSWNGSSATADGGNVELSFHVTSTSVAGTFVGGTIKGTAIHMPELIAAPAWDARMGLGTDGLTALTGVVFAAGPLATTNGVDGAGSGTVILGDSTGRSCAGTSFSWSVFPPG